MLKKLHELKDGKLVEFAGASAGVLFTTVIALVDCVKNGRPPALHKLPQGDLKTSVSAGLAMLVRETDSDNNSTRGGSSGDDEVGNLQQPSHYAW